MRCRPWLGPGPTALPAMTFRSASFPSASCLTARATDRTQPLAAADTLRPWLPSCQRCPSALLPTAPPLAVCWPAVALPKSRGASGCVVAELTAAPPRPALWSIGVLTCTGTCSCGTYHCLLTLSFMQETEENCKACCNASFQWGLTLAVSGRRPHETIQVQQNPQPGGGHVHGVC